MVVDLVFLLPSRVIFFSLRQTQTIIFICPVLRLYWWHSLDTQHMYTYCIKNCFEMPWWKIKPKCDKPWGDTIYTLYVLYTRYVVTYNVISQTYYIYYAILQQLYCLKKVHSITPYLYYNVCVVVVCIIHVTRTIIL